MDPRKFLHLSWWRIGFFALLGFGIGLSMHKGPHTLLERTAMDSAETKHSTKAKTAFEPTDWDVMPIAVIYVGILLLLVISCFAIAIAYPDSLPDASRTLNINPPGPRLQTNAAADLRRFRAEEDRRLNGYYWIDRQKGVAHIPIREAMKKLAQSGIDGFPKAQP